MDGALKGLLLAVGLIITAIVITMGFNIANKSQNTFNQGSDQLDSALAGFSEMDKQMYASGTKSGTEVIQCIQKYAETDNLYVIVFTKAGGANVYNWTLASAAGNAAAANAANAADPYATIALESQRCSGFPTKDAKGRALYFPTEDAAAQAPTGTIPVEFSSNITNNVCAESNADTTKIKISAATQVTENGSYDATLNSQDYGFISTNASFEASLQVNQNNEVKFITFVQK